VTFFASGTIIAQRSGRKTARVLEEGAYMQRGEKEKSPLLISEEGFGWMMSERQQLIQHTYSTI
jgi:hypothetical protein